MRAGPPTPRAGAPHHPVTHAGAAHPTEPFDETALLPRRRRPSTGAALTPMLSDKGPRSPAGPFALFGEGVALPARHRRRDAAAEIGRAHV